MRVSRWGAGVGRKHQVGSISRSRPNGTPADTGERKPTPCTQLRQTWCGRLAGRMHEKNTDRAPPPKLKYRRHRVGRVQGHLRRQSTMPTGPWAPGSKCPREAGRGHRKRARGRQAGKRRCAENHQPHLARGRRYPCVSFRGNTKNSV